MKRIPYAEASRALLRDSVLDAMRELLLTRDWSAITLSDVARVAGISRQTIYNEFGSRQGLAQGYALRLADRLVDTIKDTVEANVGDIYQSLLQGFRRFFAESAADPLVISLTYFPPLWRRVMDHRVLEHYDGDITKVNLQPRLREKLLARYGAAA